MHPGLWDCAGDGMPHWFAGCGMLVAGGFCYGRLLDESCIARESQNSPAPARASDRFLSICVPEKHDIMSQCRADARSERPATGHGQPRTVRGGGSPTLHYDALTGNAVHVVPSRETRW
jgi:hypothetical protein